ncbi:hypothetical protein BDN72DRAFT_857987, partial [Pluteus cervinus]
RIHQHHQCEYHHGQLGYKTSTSPGPLEQGRKGGRGRLDVEEDIEERKGEKVNHVPSHTATDPIGLDYDPIGRPGFTRHSYPLVLQHSFSSVQVATIRSRPHRDLASDVISTADVDHSLRGMNQRMQRDLDEPKNKLNSPQDLWSPFLLSHVSTTDRIHYLRTIRPDFYSLFCPVTLEIKATSLAPDTTPMTSTVLMHLCLDLRVTNAERSLEWELLVLKKS